MAEERAQTTGLEQMICFELYAASRAMTALYRPVLDDAGLTYPQYLVMRVLWHRGPVTVRDLSQILHLDSGTLSPLLKRLETQHHIRRERGTPDERTVVIHLTDTGAQLEHRVADVPQQIVCALDLNLDEYRQLHHLLGRISAATPHSSGKEH
ncbi:MarR family transcriptional regulator [Paractinoplanes ferrugineus]|uniref:MarR family transcriptional regulator n=1 Tax=Paractinoplanes ferrugineus TaxID=113564 RepID=A0A919ME95_9ACTN|nr:MarR family transcriptional regulator [Actinoplanes ferrugineus]GIE12528.1 MarR family transcriptional regulator [Actinoplanes ferrugineus]